MEISPDGKYYYFQTTAGPVHCVETQYIENFALSSADSAKQVRYFFNSPTYGGATIAAARNSCVSDPNQKQVLKVAPAGQSSTLVPCSGLGGWVARWIDSGGNLWLPVPQLNRPAGFRQGVETVQLPVQLYKLPIGARPRRH